MKLLGEVICWYEIRYHQYADDTHLYNSTPSWTGDIETVLAKCLEAIKAWLGRNQLQFNPSKMASQVHLVFYLWFWTRWHFPRLSRYIIWGSPGFTAPAQKAGGNFGLGILCTDSSSAPITPLPELRGLVHGHLDNPFGLLQCFLTGAALEEHLDTSTCPEHSSGHSDGYSLRFAHVTSLVPKLHWLPVSSQCSSRC